MPTHLNYYLIMFTLCYLAAWFIHVPDKWGSDKVNISTILTIRSQAHVKIWEDSSFNSWASTQQDAPTLLLRIIKIICLRFYDDPGAYSYNGPIMLNPLTWTLLLLCWVMYKLIFVCSDMCLSMCLFWLRLTIPPMSESFRLQNLTIIAIFQDRSWIK